MKRRTIWGVAFALFGITSAVAGDGRSPVLDMHLHASTADGNGPPGISVCIPMLGHLPARDPAKAWPEQFMESLTNPTCDTPIKGSLTDEDVMNETIAELVKNNAVGVLSGPPDRVRIWMEAAPGRFIPSLQLNVERDPYDAEAARKLLSDGGFLVLGEVSNQYSGIAPDDPRMAPFWTVAAELDVPVALHMGGGPPGTAALFPRYRPSLGNPMLLEPILEKHPTLRISIMHMGEGFQDELKMVLYSYPNVFVDIGGLMWMRPAEDFEQVVVDLVNAGYADRLMFGSDQMNWPGLISPSIDIIRDADYLTKEQKEGTLFSNAARFLKMDASALRARALGD